MKLIELNWNIWNTPHTKIQVFQILFKFFNFPTKVVDMEIVLESTDHEVFMSLDLTRARGNSFSDFPIIPHEEEDESIPEPLRAIFDITDFSNYEVEAEKLKSKIEQAEIDNEREHDLLALLEDMHMGNAVNIAKLKSRIDNLTAAHNEGNKLKHSIATGTMPIFIKESEVSEYFNLNAPISQNISAALIIIVYFL